MPKKVTKQVFVVRGSDSSSSEGPMPARSSAAADATEGQVGGWTMAHVVQEEGTDLGRKEVATAKELDGIKQEVGLGAPLVGSDRS